MQIPRVRITIGRMMVAVAVVALVTAIALEIPPTIDPFLRDRGYRLRVWPYRVVVVMLTGLIAAPLIAGTGLFLGGIMRARRERRLPVRRLLGGLALLGVGLSILLRPLPLDGMRQGYQVNSGTWVSFYHQYRFWPGRHITPCVELYEPAGRQRIYEIPVERYYFLVLFRSNADRTMIWFVDVRSKDPNHEVLCSLNLITGEFISRPGPFPAGVGETGK